MTHTQVDPTRWLNEHGDVLFRYARLRLRSDADAEDAVQEALLAALSAFESFDGRSRERTWLIGILRNKVLDVIRRQARDDAMKHQMAEELETETAGFPHDHHAQVNRWHVRGLSNLEQQELAEALAEAVARLPITMRVAFCLREMDQISTDDVCRVLNVSRSNFWTLIHRAKVKLRDDLDAGWFSTRGKR